MVEKRNIRASESRPNTRGKEARAKTPWKPASLLDAPPARPGMVQRWVSINGSVKGGFRDQRILWVIFQYRQSTMVSGQDASASKV